MKIAPARGAAMVDARACERGSAPLAFVGGCALVMIIVLALGDVASLLLARNRAQSAADAAALSAAQQLVPGAGPATPESMAHEFAERNGAELVDCLCDLGDSSASVTVRAPVNLLFARSAQVTAHAKADVDLAGFWDR